jgi:photosystem II P680 reaction center D1 protein
MTATRRRESVSVWNVSLLGLLAENRLYRLVWLLMFPTLLTATSCYICIHRSSSSWYRWYPWAKVGSSLLYGNIISVADSKFKQQSACYPIWEAAVDEWLYNGGPYQLIVTLLIRCCILHGSWMGYHTVIVLGSS